MAKKPAPKPAAPADKKPQYPLEQRNQVAAAKGIRLVDFLRNTADFTEAMKVWWDNHQSPSNEEVKHAEGLAESYAFSRYIERGGSE